MDIEQLIRQTVQDIRAEEQGAAQQTAAVTQPTSQPITVTIQGRQVTFRDQADLETQLNQTAEALRAQQAPQEPTTPAAVAGARVTGDEAGSGFTNEEYVKLMNEDPRKATNYLLSHTMFQGAVEDPMALIRESMIQSATVNRQLSAYQFRDAHREVPLEDPRVGNTVEKFRTDLGLPFTSQGLEAAYIYAVSKGALPDFKAVAAAQAQQQTQGQTQQPNPYAQAPLWQTQAPQYQPQQPTNPYLQAPPTGGRSAITQTPITTEDIDNMSAEQLKVILDRLALQGAV